MNVRSLIKLADRYKFRKYVSITRNSLYKSSRQWTVHIRTQDIETDKKITITRNCWQFNASADVFNWRNICLFISHSANLLNLYLIRRRLFQSRFLKFSSNRFNALGHKSSHANYGNIHWLETQWECEKLQTTTTTAKKQFSCKISLCLFIN